MKRACLCAVILFCAALLMFVPGKNYQRELSNEILRFHVVANSNSIEDQSLKLKIRDRVAQLLSEPLDQCESLSESMTMVECLLPDIEQEAQLCIEEEGLDMAASATVDVRYFPVKTYGTMTFPRGFYKALTIEVGHGLGRNWWCVLFPKLCFVDGTVASVPESSKKQLEECLTDEAYDSLYEGEKVELRFKLWDMITEKFENMSRKNNE